MKRIIENLPKEQLYQLLGDILKSFYEDFEIDKKCKEPITIDGFVRDLSKSCDSFIIQARNEGLTYVSGRLGIIMTSNENKFFTKISCYFQKKNGEWVVKSADSQSLPLSTFNKADQLDLKSKGIIEFSLNEPAE